MTTETQSPETTGTTPASTGQTGTTPTASEFSSFLGVEPESLPSLQPVQTPEPKGAETEQSAEAGTETEGETQEAVADEQTEEQGLQAEEVDDNWLPTEQEKEFPLEVLVKFGKRYGYTPEDIQADPRLQNSLKDKLNTDIYVEQLRQDLEGHQLEETEASNELEQTSEVAATTTTDPQTEYNQRVDAMVSRIDQKATEELGKGLLAAFGVNVDVAKLDQMLADPKLTPEHRAEVQGAKALAQNASKVGTTLARGAIDLVMTTLPELLPQILETVAPGMLTNYNQFRINQEQAAVYSSAWSELRSQVPNLPEYRTPEYKALVLKAEKQLGLNDGELGSMVFKGADGKTPLPIDQQARAVYRIVARVANGQPVAPATVARAVSAGRQQERVVQTRRAAGGALGAGTTSRQFTQDETPDEVRDNLRKAIADQNSQGNPFAGARSV